ncbi:MAG: hypothetical protein L0Y72_29705 [Gemmataceae bacterium]|nr:hypothetical protein [Gemmataceae bacterium]MCI0743223.1 hypothetical protein [Gemmataceae bacterium]
MLVITRIPTHRNNGAKITQRLAEDGRTYEETSYRLEVLVPAERVSEARDLFIQFGKQLGQRAISKSPLALRESGRG